MRLTLTLEIIGRETPRIGRYGHMAEEWLKHLAHQIKAKDDPAAAEATRKAQLAAFINRSGHEFMMGLKDSLIDFSVQFLNDMGDSPSKSDLQFTANMYQGRPNVITVRRLAYPYLNGSITLRIPEAKINVSVERGNPDSNSRIAGVSGTYSLQQGPHGALEVLEDAGERKVFHHPKDFAEALFKLLLTLP